MTEQTPTVETQRAELAATVEALAAKADVPTRMREAVHERQHRLRAHAPVVAATVGGLVAAIVVTALLSRRTRSRRTGKGTR